MSDQMIDQHGNTVNIRDEAATYLRLLLEDHWDDADARNVFDDNGVDPDIADAIIDVIRAWLAR